MADTIFDETTQVEITPLVMESKRTPSLSQVSNVSLNGLAYVQCIGPITYQDEVEFVIHKDSDITLLNAWKNGDLVRVENDGESHHGYIIKLKLNHDFAEGYHTGSITIQEERLE